MAVWYLMRGSGVVSLLLLTGVVALGVGTTRGVRIGSLPRFATMALHRSTALLATVFVAIHVATAVIDPDAVVRLIDVVVPFTARSQPLRVGLGALSLDLILALIVTGLLRARIGRRAFRAVHWGSYAAWPVALLHSLGMGTDASTIWMRAVAGACIATVAAALAWRLRGMRVSARPQAAPAR
jgi:sulfoxide reductase heme-binding subunit YedZ